MWRSVLLVAALATTASIAHKVDEVCAVPSSPECEAFALDWIDKDFEVELRDLTEEKIQAMWVYKTNNKQEHQDAMIAAIAKETSFKSAAWRNYITKFDIDSFNDETLKRRLNKLRMLGEAAVQEDKFREFTDTTAQMESVYNGATICPFENQDCDLTKDGLSLQPDLHAILANTDPAVNSYEKIQYVWEAWREASGKQMRGLYTQYVGLHNEAAIANGLNDGSELWLKSYTDDLNPNEDFQLELEDIWQKVRPLYIKLHAYIRHKYLLAWNEASGQNKFDPHGPIPAHLSGNMWSLSWENTFNLVKPFPEAENRFPEIDQTLIDQNYTVLDLFNMSNDFYLRLGMIDMVKSYTTRCGQEDTPENKECQKTQPMIQKPDWDVTCEASAWDMGKEDKSDYRIKMCTSVTLEDLLVIHNEMGHIQYFMQYANQSLQFRKGANPGFHQAIGDTMALSVQNPSHLQMIGLFDNIPISYESDINFLMRQAMKKVMFLPFAYIIDQYRWSIYDGSTNTKDLNAKWWKLREKYQGIAPPSVRNETFFDAGSKFHVAANVPYIHYFLTNVLVFDFYQEMCLEAGQYDPMDPQMPLYKCDFSQGRSDKAASLLKTLLQAGASRPWPDILESVTGSRKMDASAILEYFSPLDKWISEYIALNDIPVGW